MSVCGAPTQEWYENRTKRRQKQEEGKEGEEKGKGGEEKEEEGKGRGEKRVLQSPGLLGYPSRQVVPFT